MLSNSSKYSLKAVIFLALDINKDRKVGAKEIASSIDVPLPFLAKLLQDLAREKIISSTKGPSGGFYLTEENKAQKLLVIIEHIDGLSKFNECILGLKDCSLDKPCPVHFLVQPLRKVLIDEMNNNSISVFAKKVQIGTTFLSL